MLLQHRSQIQCLDAELQATRGIQPALLTATLELIYPKNNSFTAVAEDVPDQKLTGQFLLQAHSAHLTFLYPGTSDNFHQLCRLTDFLDKKAGEMGALLTLASVVEPSTLFDALRRAGFCSICQQTVWQLKIDLTENAQSDYVWESINERDHIAIRACYQKWVPLAVQSALPLDAYHYPNYVLHSKDQLIGMAEIRKHNRCFFIIPHLHPSIEDMPAVMYALVYPLIVSRPLVYVLSRSFQQPLESCLSHFASPIIGPQKLMVNHFTARQRVRVPVAHPAVVNNHHAEPTIPSMPSFHQDKC